MESGKIELPPNPCEKANIFSKCLFAWTGPFFKKSYKRDLDITDVYEPLKSDRSEFLGHRLETIWDKKRLKSKGDFLFSVIMRTFWKEYVFLGALLFCNEIVLRLGQPYLLGYLLKYFQKNTEVSYSDAIIFAVGIVILNALNAILFNHIYYVAFRNGMKARVAICSLIYRKALRLSQTALDEVSAGNVVNLISNDVNHFDWASYFINYLWVGPLLTLTVAVLLSIEIGFISLIGIFVVFIFVPPISLIGKLTSKYHLETAIKTDERVRFMNEIISSVQVIKMYAWEQSFAKLVALTRRMELKSLRKMFNIRVMHMVSIMFTTRFALFCTMLGMVLINGPEQIIAARIFAMSTYFSIVSNLMSQRFSRGINELAEIQSSLKRIQTFLMMDEKEPDNLTSDPVQEIYSIDSTGRKSIFSILMRDVRARWATPTNEHSLYITHKRQKQAYHSSNKKGSSLKEREKHITTSYIPTLSNINVNIVKGQLIGVVGPVGAGKSSFLQALLREIPLESGSIAINGSISYASQEPWVFAASVRQNILFGEEYDYGRYNAVVYTCALIKDFAQFDHGDLTIVGERGASLSGGQKARVNLARACYRDADIYLFDDPLSAVDAHVGTHIFNKCIGPRSRLARRGSTRILVTHQIQFLKEADWLIVLKDGKIELQGTPADVYDSHIDFEELTETIETPENRETKEIFHRQKSERLLKRSSVFASKDFSEMMIKMPQGNEKDIGLQLEASSKGIVKGSLTYHYFKAGVHWSVFFLLVLSFLLVQALASGIDFWVSIWTEQERLRATNNSSSAVLSTDTCILIDSILLATLLIFSIVRSFGYYEIIIRVAQNIHNMMFNGIISTSMRFFDTNPSGRILNRFSRDLKAIDELLPKYLFDSTQNLLTILGSIVVVSIANPYFLLPVLVLLVAFILVRIVYLKTSKNLKRLEGIALSPTLTHLAVTLNDLSTVRAYRNQDILRREFDHLQDTQSACTFMSLSTSSMFGLSLDIVCTLFVACVIFYFMFVDTGVSGEKIGLSVSQTIFMTGLASWGARQNTDATNETVSVERVLEYRELKPEPQPKEPLSVTPDWPPDGCIEFQDVSYRYFAGDEPVLRNLSFVIKPKEKIGIVGRTGAGKSSLIGAVYRLGLIEGEIFIDGIDTADILLNDLRKNIAIIPQDPVLFSGDLRKNLDPFEEYSDAEIWNALDGVELKNSISEAIGLQSPVLPHGSNYSVGQRQLLCLARAILRKNRILVLDEATANVDPHTDALIQQTIRDKFNECTVLTVAHRLLTIIDYNRVMVMDGGKMAEFDEPYNLLQNKQSIFYGMVKAMGDQEFDQLLSDKFTNK